MVIHLFYYNILLDKRLVYLVAFDIKDIKVI